MGPLNCPSGRTPGGPDTTRFASRLQPSATHPGLGFTGPIRMPESGPMGGLLPRGLPLRAAWGRILGSRAGSGGDTGLPPPLRHDKRGSPLA